MKNKSDRKNEIKTKADEKADVKEKEIVKEVLQTEENETNVEKGENDQE